MTKLIVTFCNFANAPKNGECIQLWNKTGFKMSTLKLQNLIVPSPHLLQINAVLSVEILTLRCVIPVVCVTNEREENIVKQHN